MPALALDWSSFPVGKFSASGADSNSYDAIVIGSGLGGLSCAAAFARQGFKPLVLEQHTIPGGYATHFKRPGGFVFDVSLHSTTAGERNGVHNLIPGFPEIMEVEYVPHPHLHRIVLPDYDIRIPQKNPKEFISILTGHFPEEKQGIAGIFEDMEGLTRDISRYSGAGDQVNMAKFPQEFPYLFKSLNKTWGSLLDLRIKDPKLKAIISSQWGYYGLPPSKLASIYYAMPFWGYLSQGGYYPIGRSQKISNAFVKFIEERGGQVMLKTRVERILTKEHAAYGVITKGGDEFTAKVVIANANAWDAFHTMMDASESEFLKTYLARMDKFSVSLSSFLVFLGLNKDLVKETGIEDSEIFYEASYDMDATYSAYLAADVEHSGCGLTLYDNVYKGYSPEGKNTVGIIVLQGYGHWEPFAKDYWQGKKDAYHKEKNRMADILIDKVEKSVLPGLRDAIEVKEIGTPLTNIRYTSNYRGAIYGWDQTLDNTVPRRLPHKTPIKNLYLAGAWTTPGHGYGAVIPSGLECFGEIMQEWA